MKNPTHPWVEVIGYPNFNSTPWVWKKSFAGIPTNEQKKLLKVSQLMNKRLGSNQDVQLFQYRRY